MSTIPSQPKPNSEQLTRIIQSSPMQERRIATSPQEEVMPHSWSIGTTRAAKDRVASNRRKEECPPEVYIG